MIGLFYAQNTGMQLNLIHNHSVAGAPCV
jgi:hypothetical protein